MASAKTIFHSAYRLQSIVEILSSHGEWSDVNMSVFHANVFTYIF